MRQLLQIIGLVVVLAWAFEAQSTAIIQPHPNVLKSAPDLNPIAYHLAMRAYHCARQKHLDKAEILTIIDFTKPSDERRLWVIDLKNHTVPFYTLVAHGHGSGGLMATHFSDRVNSHESSLGLYKTGTTYFGHNGYSLNLHGLDKGFNDRAFQRRVVVHGARYVSDAFAKKYHRIGRSWGCPALSRVMVKPVINTIKNGTLLFIYYPYHAWLSDSIFLHCKDAEKVGHIPLALPRKL